LREEAERPSPPGPSPKDWARGCLARSPAEECCDFIFKNPDRKRDALLGIIKILR
jgi:hypothetical protein